MRLATPLASWRGHGRDLAQHAVDAEAHGQLVGLRLDVDVRRAVIDGLRDDPS